MIPPSHVQGPPRPTTHSLYSRLRRWFTPALLFLVVLACLAPSVLAQQTKRKRPQAEKADGAKEPKTFEVRRYAFLWFVSEVDGSELVLRKTGDVTEIILYGVPHDERKVVVPIKSAAKIGRKLCEFDSYRELWANASGEKHSEILVGGLTVGFVHTDDFGVRAYVYGAGHTKQVVPLTHAQALEFGRSLIRADDMAAYIGSRVSFDR